jgi:hypothetical protein
MSDNASGGNGTRRAIRTPRAAAVAGIVFSVLLTATFVLVRWAVRSDPDAAGDWLTDGGRRDAFVLALNLLPFAVIACERSLASRWRSSSTEPSPGARRAGRRPNRRTGSSPRLNVSSTDCTGPLTRNRKMPRARRGGTTRARLDLSTDAGRVRWARLA